uniref:Uncharacterized protein n=1 Tax=viral metagenome TaxID=1070528 RepID=A0A2V0RHT4_9ZZZZ
MLLDISGSNKLSNKEVSNYLSTPKSAGGGGYWTSDSSEWMTISHLAESVITTLRPGQVRNFSIIKERLVAKGVTDSNVRVDRHVAQMVQGVSLPQLDITETFIPVNKFAPFYMGSWTGTKTPLRARQAEAFTAIEADVFLDFLLEQKAWNRIHTEWVDPSFETLSRQIEKKTGRGVWIMWLKGKLPYSIPVIAGYSDLLPLKHFDGLAPLIWSAVLRHSKVDLLIVKRSAYTLELLIRDLTEGGSLRLGG